VATTEFAPANRKLSEQINAHHKPLTMHADFDVRVGRSSSAFAASSATRCASAIQIVRPWELMAETQPERHPVLLRLSAIVSQCFTRQILSASGYPEVTIFYPKKLNA
jgi:hypothetical protein